MRVNSMHRKVRPRSIDVRKNTGGAAEYMILQLHPFVNRDIVLDPDPIADADIVRHIDILAQGTVLPYHRPTLHVAEMPNLGARANLHIIIDIAAFVNKGS